MNSGFFPLYVQLRKLSEFMPSSIHYKAIQISSLHLFTLSSLKLDSLETSQRICLLLKSSGTDISIYTVIELKSF